MTTFVVTLFLPYTIDFGIKPTPAPTRKPSPAPVEKKLPSKPGLTSRPTLLAQAPRNTPPQTPAAALAEAEDFFSRRLPGSAEVERQRPNPDALAHTDSLGSQWGNLERLNQPRSRAFSLPPSTILRYSKGDSNHIQFSRDGAGPVLHNSPTGRKVRVARSRSRENQFEGKSWTVAQAAQGNGGLVNAVRAASEEGVIPNKTWVGTLGFPSDALGEEKRQEIHEEMESEYDCLSIWLRDSDFDGAYNHYAKNILWPVFHYQIPDNPKSKAYLDHSFGYYVKLNQAFADSIVSRYKRGDVIWIHDYHLCLVPQMIRQKLQDAKICFNLHTAFPSSEVFRCLAMRIELLNGLLGANLVAFQTSEYAHHFLQTCSRLLIVEATDKGVQLDTRFVNVAYSPIGIDPDSLARAQKHHDVAEWVKVMEERYAGKRLIIGRDKLDNVRGVRQKLLAYELFLNMYPEYQTDVVLVQVATSTTEQAELDATVSDIVSRINSTFSTLAHQPLVFLKQDITFPQYMALLCVADCLVVTSLREGMNLTSHEYIFCQDGEGGSKRHSPLILSEFTGSATIFGDYVLSVNPWNYKGTAEAIREALEMSDEEKAYRHAGLHEVVLEKTGTAWVRDVMNQLKQAYEEHSVREPMSIPRLSHDELKKAYLEAKAKRLFILDYEGTLATFDAKRTVQSSPQRAIDTLNALVQDHQNIVYVMSSFEPEELERLFARVPRLGIIAENGCFLREFKANTFTELTNPEEMEKWKDGVRSILHYYQERLEGSWVEERHCSVIFHYENTKEKEFFATNQAGDCVNQINDACSSQRVHAIPVDSCAIIVEPIDWSKGTAATRLFEQLRKKYIESKQKPLPDFLFVAGNDRDDEIIFRWANKIKTSGTVKDVFTVSVGKRNTEALATVTQGVTGLLTALQKIAVAGSLNGDPSHSAHARSSSISNQRMPGLSTTDGLVDGI